MGKTPAAFGGEAGSGGAGTDRAVPFVILIGGCGEKMNFFSFFWVESFILLDFLFDLQAAPKALKTGSPGWPPRVPARKY
jgi:hypothetical protein